MNIWIWNNDIDIELWKLIIDDCERNESSLTRVCLHVWWDQTREKPVKEKANYFSGVIIWHTLIGLHNTLIGLHTYSWWSIFLPKHLMPFNQFSFYNQISRTFSQFIFKLFIIMCVILDEWNVFISYFKQLEFL